MEEKPSPMPIAHPSTMSRYAWLLRDGKITLELTTTTVEKAYFAPHSLPPDAPTAALLALLVDQISGGHLW